MPETIRNRIKAHRRVRAGDLVPHELNFRLHPERQRAAVEALYREIGCARSLLDYELPDGRLKLIDGHLRRELHPDQEMDVEVLDVTEDEARALLLSIDPLAALAETQEPLHQRLLEIAPPMPEEVQATWRAEAEAALAQWESGREGIKEFPEQYLILVTCRDEREQVERLRRWQGEGVECRALVG